MLCTRTKGWLVVVVVVINGTNVINAAILILFSIGLYVIHLVDTEMRQDVCHLNSNETLQNKLLDISLSRSRITSLQGICNTMKALSHPSGRAKCMHV